MDINKRIELLEQEITAIKKAVEKSRKDWKPEYGETYWFIAEAGNINWYKWASHAGDEAHYNIGNCYPTKEAAEFEIERLKVIAELKRFGKDRREKGKENCFLFYDTIDNKLCVNLGSYAITASIFFNSRETAKQAIAAVGADRIKKYYFRIEE